MKKPSYKDAGVDVELGDRFVRRISTMVKSTFNQNVVGDFGSFSGLYNMGDGRYLAGATDGVGTKLKLAQMLGKHDTVGIDLVAMCVNDLICSGARPLFFLDYIGSGKLDLSVSEAIVKGVVEGCQQSNCVLLGGETAELPGMYPTGEYDLAGFCVGEVFKEDLIDGKKIAPGMSLIALSSSGVHSNGYSLLRKLIKTDERELLKLALTPTKIYVKEVLALLKKFKGQIHGIANITGGGVQNIPRLSNTVDYHLDNLPGLNQISPIFKVLSERMNHDKKELYHTFNMGLGMVMVTSNDAEVLSWLKQNQLTAWKIGTVKSGTGKVHF